MRSACSAIVSCSLARLRPARNRLHLLPLGLPVRLGTRFRARGGGDRRQVRLNALLVFRRLATYRNSFVRRIGANRSRPALRLDMRVPRSPTRTSDHERGSSGVGFIGAGGDHVDLLDDFVSAGAGEASTTTYYRRASVDGSARHSRQLKSSPRSCTLGGGGDDGCGHAPAISKRRTLASCSDDDVVRQSRPSRVKIASARVSIFGRQLSAAQAVGIRIRHGQGDGQVPHLQPDP